MGDVTCSSVLLVTNTEPLEIKGEPTTTELIISENGLPLMGGFEPHPGVVIHRQLLGIFEFEFAITGLLSDATHVIIDFDAEMTADGVEGTLDGDGRFVYSRQANEISFTHDVTVGIVEGNGFSSFIQTCHGTVSR